MASIWVIECGEYSDYRVVGVFSSKENAEQIAAFLKRGSKSHEALTITEWPLDPYMDKLHAGHFPYRVVIVRDGTVEKVKKITPMRWLYGCGEWYLWRRADLPAYFGAGAQDALVGICWAIGEQHAVKIANEERTKRIALNQW